MSRLGEVLRTKRWVQCAEVLVILVGAAVIIAAGWQIVGDSIVARQAVAWIGSIAMLVLIWIGVRMRGDSVQSLGLQNTFRTTSDVGKSLLQAMLAFALGAVGFIVGTIVMGPPDSAGSQGDMSGYDFLQGNLPMLLGALALVYIGSSFAEEVVYRGFLITRFKMAFGEGKAATACAVFASAVLFGLAHFSWGVGGMVQTTGMGLGLGCAYLLTKKSLWPQVIAHAAFDTLLFMQLYAQPPQV